MYWDGEGTAYIDVGAQRARVVHVHDAPKENGAWLALFRDAPARHLGGSRFAVHDSIVTVQSLYGFPYGQEIKWETSP